MNLHIYDLLHMFLKKLPKDIVTLVYKYVHRDNLNTLNMQLLDTDRSKNPWTFEPHIKSARCSICNRGNVRTYECNTLLYLLDNHISLINGICYVLQRNHNVSIIYRFRDFWTLGGALSLILQILNTSYDLVAIINK